MIETCIDWNEKIKFNFFELDLFIARPRPQRLPPRNGLLSSGSQRRFGGHSQTQGHEHQDQETSGLLCANGQERSAYAEGKISG